MVDLDLLYVDPATFDKLDRDAVTMNCGELSLPVPSIQGMIALKLQAMRNQVDRRIRDTQDIQAILRLNPEVVALDDLRIVRKVRTVRNIRHHSRRSSMNSDLLELDLPVGTLPDLPDRVRSAEENDRWQSENHQLRLQRGDTARGPCPVEVFFTRED
jgi:hypothetical protein